MFTAAKLCPECKFSHQTAKFLNRYCWPLVELLREVVSLCARLDAAVCAGLVLLLLDDHLPPRQLSLQATHTLLHAYINGNRCIAFTVCTVCAACIYVLLINKH